MNRIFIIIMKGNTANQTPDYISLLVKQSKSFYISVNSGKKVRSKITQYSPHTVTRTQSTLIFEYLAHRLKSSVAEVYLERLDLINDKILWCVILNLLLWN